NVSCTFNPPRVHFAAILAAGQISVARTAALDARDGMPRLPGQRYEGTAEGPRSPQPGDPAPRRRSGPSLFGRCRRALAASCSALAEAESQIRLVGADLDIPRIAEANVPLVSLRRRAAEP